MYASTIVLQAVLDGNLESVSPVRNNGRAWVSTIDQRADAAQSVRRHSHIRDFEMIRDSPTGHGPCRVIVGGDTKAIGPASSCIRAISTGGVGRIRG
jgi:hypothetical protein